ncbi:9775_t:CDS:2 [Ambispora leptoticha]|uniref:9775_t:CDS:1 n=1 Tax=Ambispora leptoticha TaxID=144679 RepID=A0A9N9BWH6_9GLOM|nr:9775_t:CDS:2 [Ambispora leptoticha]
MAIFSRQFLIYLISTILIAQCAFSFESREAAINVFNRRDTNGTLLCNGNADICDLRFNQVTHAGTHNSMAYNLHFDCQNTVRNCLDSTSICLKQHTDCLASYEVHCEASTDICKQRNPKLLHWMCDGFNAICKRSDAAICSAWLALCTDSSKVCNVWGEACEDTVPDWVIECFWENHPGHDIPTQLRDGIRLLDLDTCQVEDKVVLCHGMGLARALGDELDLVFKQIRNFMVANPNEVISLEFGDIDGNATLMGDYIQKKLEQYFVNETGHSMLFSLSLNNNTWPTLRQMIETDQRIIIWYSYLYDSTPNRRPWIHNVWNWYTASYSYTADDMTAAQLNNSFTEYCDNANAKQTINHDMLTYGRVLWQTMDQTVGLVLPQVEDAIKNKTNPGYICLKQMAEAVNFDLLDYVANICYPAFPYVYRVRLDWYWRSNLFEVVKRFNEMNVARVKSGDILTPECHVQVQTAKFEWKIYVPLAGYMTWAKKKWTCSDYVSACYCCPCYLLKEIFCGWCYRNPASDDFDGIGCRPTGPETCSKCGQTPKQVKDAAALQVFNQHPGDTNRISSAPQLPALSYVGTPQMRHPTSQQQEQRRSFENRNLYVGGQNQSKNNISNNGGRKSMENQNHNTRRN